MVRFDTPTIAAVPKAQQLFQEHSTSFAIPASAAGYVVIDQFDRNRSQGGVVVIVESHRRVFVVLSFLTLLPLL